MNDKSLLLSICVPTYNRLDKLEKQISELLKIKDDRFNIVVSDNCSSDGTCNFLSGLKFKVNYFRNINPIPPSNNGLNALSKSVGKYSLYLLDKDRISAKNLPKFLDSIEKTEALFGYCELNSESDRSIFEYIDNSDLNFLKTAYLCKHPSGYFFRTDILKRVISDCDFDKCANFPFTLDIICAHFSIMSRAMLVKMPLIYTETVEEAIVSKSFTYNIDNLWFSPIQVVVRYNTFINDLFRLPITKDNKNKITKILLLKCFLTSTIDYSKFVSDPSICSHYNIECRLLSLVDVMHVFTYVSNVLKERKDFYSKYGDVNLKIIEIRSFLCFARFYLSRLFKRIGL